MAGPTSSLLSINHLDREKCVRTIQSRMLLIKDGDCLHGYNSGIFILILVSRLWMICFPLGVWRTHGITWCLINGIIMCSYVGSPEAGMQGFFSDRVIHTTETCSKLLITDFFCTDIYTHISGIIGHCRVIIEIQ